MVTRRPAAPIQHFLGCYFALTHAPGTSIQTLPDASAYLVVDLPRAAPPHCMLAGPRLKAVGSSPVRETIDYVGVRLLPGVAFLLTGSPVHLIIGERKPLSTFLGEEARQLAKKIVEANAIETRFDLLESFLLERLAGARLDERVQLALCLIEKSAGAIEIAEIANQCGIGGRQLERLLRIWVGISPKRLARIARFQAVLGHTEKSPTLQWTHIAAEQNYVDQAHMIHEFSEFTGASPTRFSALNSAKSLKANCD